MNEEKNNEGIVYPDHKDENLETRKDAIKKYAHSEIRIFTTSADNYFVRGEEAAPVIEEKLKSGCRVRVLLLNPDSEAIHDREKQEGKEKGYLSDQIRHSYDSVKIFKKKYDNLRVKFYDITPTYQALILDEKIFAALYLYGFHSRDFPRLEIRNLNIRGGLFEKFVTTFDRLWEETSNDIPESLEEKEKVKEENKRYKKVIERISDVVWAIIKKAMQ